MHKVLICSKSCALGIGREDMSRLCRAREMEAAFESLQEGILHLHDFDAVVVGTDKFTAAHFKAGKNLKAVMKFGVGTDNIDMKAAKEHGVKVLNMPGVNSDAVAGMAFAMMMAATRRVAEGDRLVRQGQWPRLMGMCPMGKTLGIVGTGAIGRLLAKMVAGLNMRIIGYDVCQNAEFESIGGEYVDFNTLLAQADYISIHVPLTTETRHLFDARAFSQMKQTAVLINTARGPIVDEKALYDALKNGKIAVAALDVFESEPPRNSPLIELNNAICLPHIAAYTVEAMRRSDMLCVETLAKALS